MMTTEPDPDTVGLLAAMMVVQAELKCPGVIAAVAQEHPDALEAMTEEMAQNPGQPPRFVMLLALRAAGTPVFES